MPAESNKSATKSTSKKKSVVKDTRPILLQLAPYLEPFQPQIEARLHRFNGLMTAIMQHSGSLVNFATQHQELGLNYDAHNGGWWYREWAPNAHRLFLTGEFNWWDRSSHPLNRNPLGIWEIFLDDETYKDRFTHGSKFKVVVHGNNGVYDRIPACIRRVIQDDTTKDFAAQVWRSEPYHWKNESPISNAPVRNLMIYEAHVGMATEEMRVGTYVEFKEKMLPRIKADGYNCIQLMAIQEHPYYGSYGYHVSSFFAPSSRFGTPEELKDLVDTAHGMGIAVIMDIVHSHAVKNFMEGLNEFDGTDYQYFIPGPAGHHELWDSKLFNYGKTEVLQFLLSNVRYWLEEFNFDGFRFDGVTSMLYHHHGNSMSFNGLGDYFTDGTNHDAVSYLSLANTLIHELKPNAISIAEDVSGMPGLCRPAHEGGLGFDYRLGMGIPDNWIKLIKEKSDEQWDLGDIWWALTNRPEHEKTVGYAESHDQALVGDQTIAFRLMGPRMYTDMARNIPSLVVDRAIALHKIIRMMTISLGGEGYLNFMGNEWGHPEWIDFPREGNNWSYAYARRQWSLADADYLRYKFLGDFDKAMTQLVHQYDLLSSPKPEMFFVDRERQIMAYRKSSLLFVVNIHPTDSAFDYGIKLPFAEAYKLILSSDELQFGGFERQPAGLEYWPDQDGNLKLYVPNRTILVYEPLALYNSRTASKVKTAVKVTSDKKATIAKKTNKKPAELKEPAKPKAAAKATKAK